MLTYLSHKPTKNSAFRLYFSTIGVKTVNNSAWSPSARIPMPSPLAFSSVTFQISKDGGSFTTLTNTPVDVSTSGDGYVDLTAAEMNADVIHIQIQKINYSTTALASDFTANTQAIVIYTNPTTVSEPGTSTQTTSFLPATLVFLVNAIEASYTLSNVDVSSPTYNYYGFAKKSGVWTIMKEAKDFSSYGYAGDNPRRQTYEDAWTNRTTLTYGPTSQV